ncbi:MAG TPA: ADP-ribosyl-[dinitrogen reductase] hydrolase [Gallionellaceae bacterium]|nr:ADP-ribosyl-[dinitrogen reductase] hydrolase [Gallionellaceae bacterium]
MDKLMAQQRHLHDRALGAYLGLAVGDALGATVEFMLPREIRYQYGVHKDIIGGGWLRLKAGRVTDDTEMSLALGRALIASGGWNANAVADSYVDWLKSRPVDIGNTCRRGIQRYILNGSLSSLASEGDAGNGAAMRNLPLVLLTLNDEQAFVELTLAQSHFTHNHPLSDAATLALGRMLRQMFREGKIKECREVVKSLVSEHPKFQFTPYPGRASGYIVDTMQTVLHHLFITDSFESLVVETINCGEDADTTGAIAGMLGGALYGVGAIPARWLDKLEQHVVSEIRQQVNKLLDLAEHSCHPPIHNDQTSPSRVSI